MFHSDHNPPHFHAQHGGERAAFDFQGNIISGNLSSRAAVRQVREWTDLHIDELEENWRLARAGKDVRQIIPLPQH